MTPLGFSLVLAAAFCHATWNFCVKRINGGPALILLVSILSVVLYAPLALWSLLHGGFTPGAEALVFIAGSVVLHLGYFMLLQVGYRKGDLSLVYPTARATGPFLSAGFAILFLGENASPQVLAGAALIIAGVLCLTGGGRGGARNVSTSLLFGLAVGGLIGTYTVWDAHAVAVLAVPPIIMDYATCLGRVVVLGPIAARAKGRAQMADLWARHRWSVLAIAVFTPLAYILVLTALTFTPVVYVAPVREVSVLLTVLAGSILLREGDLARRLKWAVVILAGMGLLVTA